MQQAQAATCRRHQGKEQTYQSLVHNRHAFGKPERSALSSPREVTRLHKSIYNKKKTMYDEDQHTKYSVTNITEQQ